MTISTNDKFSWLTDLFQDNHVDNPLTSSTVGSRINNQIPQRFSPSIEFDFRNKVTNVKYNHQNTLWSVVPKLNLGDEHRPASRDLKAMDLAFRDCNADPYSVVRLHFQ